MTITVNDLAKRFNREWIFRNLNYTFTAGSIYAVTGPNGSGKSTLLHVLWGQMPPTGGNLHYEKAGTPLPVETVFNHLSIATPYMDLIEEFTLKEMINFHFGLKSPRTGIHPEEVLQRMYLEEAADKQLINFSSGMKQRLKLGLAFFTKADVYFLDEPGTNLDKRAFDWYTAQLKQLPREAIVFIASNNPEEYPQDSRVINIMDFKR